MAAHFFTHLLMLVLNRSLLVTAALLLCLPVQAHNHDAATNIENIEAFESIEPSAKSGNPAAQRLLASMYEHGEGVEQDLQQAIYWYTQAAERDDDIAQFYLGYLHYQGVGLPISLDNAFIWFEKAAKQGNPDFQYNLGNLHRYGEGTVKALKTALNWYLLAAEQGQINAQQDLAAMYFQGNEIPKDLIKAYFWQAIANASLIDAGVLEKSSLDKIAQMLDEKQISKAKEQVSQWIKNHPELY
jgi:TPR repeat protein